MINVSAKCQLKEKTHKTETDQLEFIAVIVHIWYIIRLIRLIFCVIYCDFRMVSTKVSLPLLYKCDQRVQTIYKRLGWTCVTYLSLVSPKRLSSFRILDVSGRTMSE